MCYRRSPVPGMLAAGALAGLANGIFGGAGGIVLVLLLRKFRFVPEQALFPSAVSVMLPITAVSLWFGAMRTPIPWKEALPLMLGGAAGSLVCVWAEEKIPVLWLHRILGALILWGGFRTLWN